jgi:hypothetical protein
MRQRIYFLLPDTRSARRTMDDLLLARIEERHIHFVAQDRTQLEGLHAANLLQTSDVVHAAEAGLIHGGIAGIVLAVAAGWYLSDTMAQWQAVAVLPLIGAAFGAWASSMIGASIPNTRLKPFEPALSAGSILLIVDVPRGRVEDVEGLLASAHSEARLQGHEPTVPAFP